jgi:zinc transporter ZupT
MNIIFLSSPRMREAVICYLIAFAIGGLLGDVFFHTLPHLSSHSGHSHDHDHHHHENAGSHSHDPKEMMMNLIIIAGIVAFFLIEKVVE